MVLFLLAVAGCSLFYRNEAYNIGFDFPSENVSKIINGKTTAEEVIHLFGGPYAKSDVTDNEAVWRYYYSTSSTDRESNIFVHEAKSSHQNKTLIIRLKNGIVTHHSYSVGR